MTLLLPPPFPQGIDSSLLDVNFYLSHINLLYLEWVCPVRTVAA